MRSRSRRCLTVCAAAGKRRECIGAQRALVRSACVTRLSLACLPGVGAAQCGCGHSTAAAAAALGCLRRSAFRLQLPLLLHTHSTIPIARKHLSNSRMIRRLALLLPLLSLALSAAALVQVVAADSAAGQAQSGSSGWIVLIDAGSTGSRAHCHEYNFEEGRALPIVGASINKKIKPGTTEGSSGVGNSMQQRHYSECGPLGLLSRDESDPIPDSKPARILTLDTHFRLLSCCPLVSSGLSSYARNPSAASESIADLLAFIKETVPRNKWAQTPIHLHVS